MGDAALAVTCCVRVGGPCSAPAVEVLLVRTPQTGWEAHMRCAAHPAEAYERLVLRADPMAETLILPVPVL